VASVGAIEKLYATYKNRAHIYLVYIREAHPTDGWALPRNQFQITDPKTLEERRKVARAFAAQLNVSIPILVDTIDDRLEKAYHGWPDRIYLIDTQGKVALKGEPGPRGFRPAVQAVPAVLDKLLAGSRE
jgi:iodothyronine deiodinase-like protein